MSFAIVETKVLYDLVMTRPIVGCQLLGQEIVSKPSNDIWNICEAYIKRLQAIPDCATGSLSLTGQLLNSNTSSQVSQSAERANGIAQNQLGQATEQNHLIVHAEMPNTATININNQEVSSGPEGIFEFEK